MSVLTYTPPSDRLIHSAEVDFGGRHSLTSPVHLMQYDKSLPLVAVKLYLNGMPFKLSNGASVNLRVGKRDGTTVYNPVLGCDASRTMVYCEMTKQICSEYGSTPAILELMIGENIAGSSYLLLDIAKNPVQEGSVESSDEYKTIMEVVADAKQALDKVPIIRNGTFWTWNTSTGEYADTGISAAGEQGDTGNGIEDCVLNDDYTLTISFTDGGSYTTPRIRGDKGAKGDTGTGIVSTVLNDDYTLTITLSDGTSYTTPSIRGAVGPKGETGKGLKILGHFATVSALSSAIPNPEAGDAYGVGSAAPYDIYMWDSISSTWVNNGSLQGVKGDDGVTFTPSVSADGTMSWTNDGGLTNPEPVNIRGPAGKDGANGADGKDGVNGKDGKDAAADKTLGLTGSVKDDIPVIASANTDGKPTEWTSITGRKLVSKQIRYKNAILSPSNWNSITINDEPAYSQVVTDTEFFIDSSAETYTVIVAPFRNYRDDYLAYQIVPGDQAENGSLTFYCKPVSDACPTSGILLAMLRVPCV